MPYFITDDAAGCSGWATVKDDGEVMGCHDSKQAAIDQALAIAQSEGSTFEGERQVDLTLPEYIQEAAAQGLEYHAEGLSGDGVTAQTVREATLMARGEISEDKVVRVSAWAARHRADLDAEGARPDEDGYPTPGAVAHLLWGIPTGSRYADAVGWFDRKAEQVKADRSVGMEVTPVKPRTKGADVEFRSFTGELRQEGDGNTFVGYAAVFNSDSEPLPFIERIAPGAFGKTLRNRKQNVRLYINHNSDMVLASKNSGTLRLSEDERGLRVEADLPEDVSYSRDLMALMRRGVVDKMSFGFQVDRRGEKWSEDGTVRTLTSLRLFEVSVVTGFPAYEATAAAVRSLSALSERTGMAVDDLSDTLEALAAGEQVDAEKVEALAQIVDGALPKPEPEPENLLGLKSKQTELLAKKVF